MNVKFFIFIFFIILCPVINLGGHYINLAEFYLYLMFFVNIKNIKNNVVAMIFIRYAVLFFCTVILCAFMAQKAVNNHDIFIIRNCLQLVCAIFLFQIYSDSIKENSTDIEWQMVFYKAVFLLSLPAFFVFLQRINLFGFRDIMITLYQPKFHFLSAEIFEDMRYTSIFKDFFTSSVYFIVLSLSIVVFYLRMTLPSKFKISLLALLFFIYMAQFYVARTSVIFIPIMIVLALLLIKRKNVVTKLRNLLIFSMLCLPGYFYVTELFISSENLNENWTNEGFSSYEVMQTWNKNFYDHIAANPEILFRPNHEYDLNESKNPNLYTDSFYPQEIYRYGIYGLIAYMYLVFSLVFTFFKTERGLLVITLCLVFLNYKGGNVFFMPKDIYLLAFIFSWFHGWKQPTHQKEVMA